jgi:hypothetical protein
VQARTVAACMRYPHLPGETVASPLNDCLRPVAARVVPQSQPQPATATALPTPTLRAVPYRHAFSSGRRPMARWPGNVAAPCIVSLARTCGRTW